ncbi:YIP1 family protein [uncultured Proteiniphilum sp.]|uniref:YIP1 family protein n=1 Tax=uncultured Proteiniphilum sp. TaxID=497637 RepID=UPI00260B5A44|nr:YIP1 family protein [uncultured Proteiniphilum sp.]
MWRDIFITIAQLIVASPGAWKDLEKEKRTQHEFLSRFLHPIFGIIAFTSFVGGLWFVRDGNVENALKGSIVNVVGIYGGYFIASYILNEAAPRLGLNKDLPRFQQFTGYASVVLYALFIITPFVSELFILWILALYTIYLVNSGTLYFMKVPSARVADFTAVASAIIILAPVLVRALFSYLIK